MSNTSPNLPASAVGSLTGSKPLKNMSQQEKLALKDVSERDTNSSEAIKSAVTSGMKNVDGIKKSNQYLRASTPPGQTGTKTSDNDGASPSSQACTSGSVTPNSEGVRRSDRKPHAPPGGLDLD